MYPSKQVVVSHAVSSSSKRVVNVSPIADPLSVVALPDAAASPHEVEAQPEFTGITSPGHPTGVMTFVGPSAAVADPSLVTDCGGRVGKLRVLGVHR